MKKIVLSRRIGKRASRLFLITATLVSVQAAYIIYTLIAARHGVCPLGICEMRELIQSEAASLLLSLGGVLLMDIEEKNSERT